MREATAHGLESVTTDSEVTRHRYDHLRLPSPRYNVKAYACGALVTLVHCDARIHHPNLAPLFDDVHANLTRRLAATMSGEEDGRANRVLRLPDLTYRLPRRRFGSRAADKGRH